MKVLTHQQTLKHLRKMADHNCPVPSVFDKLSSEVDSLRNLDRTKNAEDQAAKVSSIMAGVMRGQRK